MAEYRKPIPTPSPETQEFWAGCKRHELLVQHCKDCGRYIYYPRILCPDCSSTNIEWVKSSGRGEVYTYSVHYRGPTREFKDDVPYVVALIDMEEGWRMMSNIVGCDPEEVKIGSEVEVVFEDITDEISLPKFKLI